MKWKPQRRIETDYQKILYDLFTKFSTAIITSRRRDAIMNMANKIVKSYWFKDFARSAAYRMITMSRADTAKSWREAARKSSKGREIFESLKRETDQDKIFQDLLSRNMYYIKSAPLEMAERMSKHVAEAQIAGRRPEQIAEELQTLFPHMTKAKAKLIARTESARASAEIVQARSQRLGYDWYLWKTSDDQRVRGSHRHMDEVICNYNDPPSPERLKGEKSYGVYGPGETFNCFPGSTSVNLSNGCNKLWRRRYKGPTVNLRLSNGAFLQATSNHPVLTTNGWLPINEVQKNDYLFESFVDSSSIFNHNKNQFVTSFEDTFNSLRRFCPLETTLGSKLYFHGDGTEDNIDIISTDSLLSDYVMSIFFKKFSEFYFSRSNVNSAQIVFGRNSLFSKPFDRVFTPHSIVCLANNFFSFITSKFGHSDVVGFTPISSGDNVISQDFRYCSSATFVELRNGKFTFSPKISFDYILLWKAILPSLMQIFGQYNIPNAELSSQSVTLTADVLTNGSHCGSFHYSPCAVVDKFVSEFDGHVYNLQNLSSWYSITHNNIIVHNCRCYASPVFDVDDINWPHKVCYGGRIVIMNKNQFKGIM